MARHAFLIAAYENYYVLERLMRLLDDGRNDIYLHVDRKAKGFDVDKFAALCTRSRVTMLPRRKVYWGEYSQVVSILRMMRAALTGGDYTYLHLLSDSDLPLKSTDEIHRFFSGNTGREFVAFNEFPAAGNQWVKYGYPFNRYLRSQNRLVRATYARVRPKLLAAQRRLGVDRTQRLGVELRYGSDWYSVTAPLASHLVSSESEICRMFKHAFIPTEFYVQTLVWNSRFRDQVFDFNDPYHSNMRLIDFKRGDGKGSPLTWRHEHLDELLESDRVFARKFDPKVDRQVIDEIFDHLNANPLSKP